MVFPSILFERVQAKIVKVEFFIKFGNTVQPCDLEDINSQFIFKLHISNVREYEIVSTFYVYKFYVVVLHEKEISNKIKTFKTASKTL